MADIKEQLGSLVRQPRDVQEVDTLLSGLKRQGRLNSAMRKLADSLERSSSFSILSDEPAAIDELDFGPTVKAVSQVVLSKSTETPLTIGFDGEWGSGKTSILKMIEARARTLDYSCIWLNAWSLEKTEGLMAAVAAGIQDELRSQGRIKRFFLREVILRLNQSIASIIPGGRSLAALLQTALIFNRTFTDIEEVAGVAKTTHAFEQLVKILLSDEADRGYSDRRLVVFIDDLDRALPDQVTDILKNLKLILESPRCIFILAMDVERVSAAIDQFYRQRSIGYSSLTIQGQNNLIDASLLGGDGGNGEFGRRYLEKILQVQIKVPRLSRAKAIQYAKSIGVVDEAMEIVRWAPLDDLHNPRRLKRYLNWLSISLMQLAESEIPNELDNLYCLRALALKRDWPEVYDGLLEGIPIHDLPANLKGYVEATGSGDKDLESVRALFEEHIAKVLDSKKLHSFESFLNSSVFFS